MTDAIDLAVLASNDPSGGASTGSAAAGALLKKAREGAGLHIAALAVSLKVPVSKLEALEQGLLEALSGPVFVRALASSVCRTLKVDSAEVLSLLPTAQLGTLAQQSDLNAPFKGAGRSVQFSGPSSSLALSVFAVAFLLFGTALLLFLPQLHEWADSWSSDSVQVDKVPGVEPTVVSAAEPKGQTNLPVVATSEATVPVPSPVAVLVDGKRDAVTTSLGAALVASKPVNAVKATVVDVATGLLSFRSNGPSWVEVSDVNGVVVLRKTLESGDPVAVNGVPPFKVVIGRVDATELWVRGKWFDLATVANGNVAKFEVK